MKEKDKMNASNINEKKEKVDDIEDGEIISDGDDDGRKEEKRNDGKKMEERRTTGSDGRNYYNQKRDDDKRNASNLRSTLSPKKLTISERWKKENLLCNAFREAQCQRNEKTCKYSHDAATSKRKPIICKYYQNGYCRYGLKCCYLHGEYPCLLFHHYNACEKIPCKYSHVPLNDFTKYLLQQIIKDHTSSSSKPLSKLSTPIKHHLSPPYLKPCLAKPILIRDREMKNNVADTVIDVKGIAAADIDAQEQQQYDGENLSDDALSIDSLLKHAIEKDVNVSTDITTSQMNSPLYYPHSDDESSEKETYWLIPIQKTEMDLNFKKKLLAGKGLEKDPRSQRFIENYKNESSVLQQEQQQESSSSGQKDTNFAHLPPSSQANEKLSCSSVPPVTASEKPIFFQQPPMPLNQATTKPKESSSSTHEFVLPSTFIQSGPFGTEPLPPQHHYGASSSSNQQHPSTSYANPEYPFGYQQSNNYEHYGNGYDSRQNWQRNDFTRSFSHQNYNAQSHGYDGFGSYNDNQQQQHPHQRYHPYSSNNSNNFRDRQQQRHQGFGHSGPPTASYEQRRRGRGGGDGQQQQYRGGNRGGRGDGRGRGGGSNEQRNYRGRGQYNNNGFGGGRGGQPKFNRNNNSAASSSSGGGGGWNKSSWNPPGESSSQYHRNNDRSPRYVLRPRSPPPRSRSPSPIFSSKRKQNVDDVQKEENKENQHQE